MGVPNPESVTDTEITVKKRKVPKPYKFSAIFREFEREINHTSSSNSENSTDANGCPRSQCLCTLDTVAQSAMYMHVSLE